MSSFQHADLTYALLNSAIVRSVYCGRSIARTALLSAFVQGVVFHFCVSLNRRFRERDCVCSRMPCTFAIEPKGWRRINQTMVLAINGGEFSHSVAPPREGSSPSMRICVASGVICSTKLLSSASATISAAIALELRRDHRRGLLQRPARLCVAEPTMPSWAAAKVTAAVPKMVRRQRLIALNIGISRLICDINGSSSGDRCRHIYRPERMSITIRDAHGRGAPPHRPRGPMLGAFHQMKMRPSMRQCP